MKITFEKELHDIECWACHAHFVILNIIDVDGKFDYMECAECYCPSCGRYLDGSNGAEDGDENIPQRSWGWDEVQMGGENDRT